MLVLIGKLLLSTAKGFNGFSGFLHNFVLANLAVSSIRVKAKANMYSVLIFDM